MSRRACETCEWWIAVYDGAPHGTCRGGPPAVDGAATVWPATDADEWCGRWRLAERLAGGRDGRKR